MNESHKPNPTASPSSSPSWEDQPAFRELFLLHVPAFAVPALREMGRHMYDALLDGELPEPDEPWVRARVRALARDLRFTAQVLASLGEERVAAGLTPEEMALSIQAETWARELEELVGAIEGSIGSPKEAP